MPGYYYFAASLPMLKKNTELPFSSKEFISLCSSQIADKDLAVLSEAVFDGSGNAALHAVIDLWNNFITALHIDLAYSRAEKMGIDSVEYSVSFRQIPGTVEIVKQLMQASNPLEAENLLFSVKWDFIEELCTNHFFDLVMLITYYLKIQLLERHSAQNKEQGLEAFKHIFSNIQATDESL
ncbi:MAG: DUF2764 family protein [Bacteroidetes bacterium]|nr:DUF2764 family protein [Bacteroidota bacterium]